ncbi:YraN family protein [Patescibacteria group bacterium]|nr:YraN family protein [Patescibacteria group bacterium]
MVESTTVLGKQGEELARRYLEGKGYRIREQNYRTKRAEIDLIAEHGRTLVFVEVRTKSNERFGSPEETLTNEKRRRMLRNAQAYVSRTRHKEAYRIDAVCVILGPRDDIRRITHYENIVP